MKGKKISKSDEIMKNLISVPYDFNAYYERLIESAKAAKEQEAIENQKEKERINSIKCPVCKSINKHHHTKYKSNGVYGPGAYSYLTEDYLICLDCGVHFSDLEKIKK